MKIVFSHFEKITILFLGPIGRMSIFEAGMFIFARHRPLMNEFVNAEYAQSLWDVVVLIDNPLRIVCGALKRAVCSGW
jgi:hypothetical protein